MKNSLSKATRIDGLFGAVILDIWDIDQKRIVFSGSAKECSKFTNKSYTAILSALKTGYRLGRKNQKQYAVRIASQKTKG